MSPGEVGDSTLCTDSCFPYPTLIAVSVLDFIVSGPALFYSYPILHWVSCGKSLRVFRRGLCGENLF